MSAYLRRGPRSYFRSECCTGGESVAASSMNRFKWHFLRVSGNFLEEKAFSNIYLFSIKTCKKKKKHVMEKVVLRAAGA